jgi:Ras GTPase-activating-like protein IQGAP1
MSPYPLGMAAVDHINAVLQEGDPENTLLALKKPEAQLPAVYPFAAVMYQNELFNLQKQNTSVRHSCVCMLIPSPSKKEGC